MMSILKHQIVCVKRQFVISSIEAQAHQHQISCAKHQFVMRLC
jgi:hypothetical protein